MKKEDHKQKYRISRFGYDDVPPGFTIKKAPDGADPVFAKEFKELLGSKIGEEKPTTENPRSTSDTKGKTHPPTAHKTPRPPAGG